MVKSKVKTLELKWYYVKKKYKLNVDFFAESTESDSVVFRSKTLPVLFLVIHLPHPFHANPVIFLACIACVVYSYFQIVNFSLPVRPDDAFLQAAPGFFLLFLSSSFFPSLFCQQSFKQLSGSFLVFFTGKFSGVRMVLQVKKPDIFAVR